MQEYFKIILERDGKLASRTGGPLPSAQQIDGIDVRDYVKLGHYDTIEQGGIGSNLIFRAVFAANLDGREHFPTLLAQCGGGKLECRDVAIRKTSHRTCDVNAPGVTLLGHPSPRF